MELTLTAARGDGAGAGAGADRSACRSASTSAIAARANCCAIGLGNAGRAVPELALIALVAALIGVGLVNVAVALALLGIPPILTNAYVGVRQVDRATVDAARGMGMTEFEIIRKVELPLAIPTVMGGDPRGDDRDRRHRHHRAAGRGRNARRLRHQRKRLRRRTALLAGAILVAALALALEGLLALLQRRLTSDGLKLQTA